MTAPRPRPMASPELSKADTVALWYAVQELAAWISRRERQRGSSDDPRQHPRHHQPARRRNGRRASRRRGPSGRG